MRSNERASAFERCALGWRLCWTGAASVVFALACSTSRSTRPGQPADAARDAEAGFDASPDVAGVDADAQTSSCTGPPDGGALSAPEAIVTAEPNLDGLTLSNQGPVWLENTEQPSIWLASNPPRLLFDAAASPLSPGAAWGAWFSGPGARSGAWAT